MKRILCGLVFILGCSVPQDKSNMELQSLRDEIEVLRSSQEENNLRLDHLERRISKLDVEFVETYYDLDDKIETYSERNRQAIRSLDSLVERDLVSLEEEIAQLEQLIRRLDEVNNQFFSSLEEEIRFTNEVIRALNSRQEDLSKDVEILKQQ